MLNAVFRGTIDNGLVREQWDQLVRLAASLRDRTAHVVLERLAASLPSDRLAKALILLGRVVKTTYILRYAHDAQVRDRVRLQFRAHMPVLVKEAELRRKGWEVKFRHRGRWSCVRAGGVRASLGHL